MKGLSFILAAAFLFLTSSCNNTHNSDTLGLNSEIKQVIFFSDEENYKNEASYYDAIIELKKEFPEEIKQMKIMPTSSARKYYDLFEVEQSPAIVVVYGDRVIAKVKGSATKDQIIEPLSAVLQTGETAK